MRDPYQVLGVSPDATEDELKKAFNIKTFLTKYQKHMISQTPLELIPLDLT